MKKKFKFNLEGLLKLRAMREQECKTKIGRIQIEIENIKGQIRDHDNGIYDIYSSQEEILKDGASGQELKFFPFFFEAKENHIKQLEQVLEYKSEELKELFEELKTRRAELKIIMNMKEKKFEEHKKEITKKENIDLDERVLQWLGHNKLE